MPYQVPDEKVELLKKAIVVGLSTLLPDGQPQSTPVWCSWDGDLIWINTAEGRQKDQNLQRDPRATVLAIDPDNPYRYLEVRTQVAERTTEGALDHINQLSEMYTGNADYYARNPSMRGQEVRVIYKRRPIEGSQMG